jgi:hypothetical protein
MVDIENKITNKLITRTNITNVRLRELAQHITSSTTVSATTVLIANEKLLLDVLGIVYPD